MIAFQFYSELLCTVMYCLQLIKPVCVCLFQVQTRSADEPMTTFVLCNECGNRWKVRLSLCFNKPYLLYLNHFENTVLILFFSKFQFC